MLEIYGANERGGGLFTADDGDSTVGVVSASQNTADTSYRKGRSALERDSQD